MWEVTIRQADTGAILARETYDDLDEARGARVRAASAALTLAGDWEVEFATEDRSVIVVDRYRGGELVA